MHCKFCPDLTFRLMRIGCALHDAERLTTFLLTGIVVVATIMGCIICPSGEDENRLVCGYPGVWNHILRITGLQYCGLGNSINSQWDISLNFNDRLPGTHPIMDAFPVSPEAAGRLHYRPSGREVLIPMRTGSILAGTGRFPPHDELRNIQLPREVVL
jgi:hypothetical protein